MLITYNRTVEGISFRCLTLSQTHISTHLLMCFQIHIFPCVMCVYTLVPLYFFFSSFFFVSVVLSPNSYVRWFCLKWDYYRTAPPSMYVHTKWTNNTGKLTWGNISETVTKIAKYDCHNVIWWSYRHFFYFSVGAIIFPLYTHIHLYGTMNVFWRWVFMSKRKPNIRSIYRDACLNCDCKLNTMHCTMYTEWTEHTEASI